MFPSSVMFNCYSDRLYVKPFASSIMSDSSVMSNCFLQTPILSNCCFVLYNVRMFPVVSSILLVSLLVNRLTRC